MANENEINFDLLDDLLGQTDLNDVTAESSGFEALPNGYYLCEVKEAKLTTSKTSNKPMVSVSFVVTEDGRGVAEDGAFFELSKTKGRMIWVNYVLSEASKVKRFVTDMLKFEGEVEGEPLLGKEYFTNHELLEDALDILSGMQIWVNVETTEKDGNKNTWNNLISWKRAEKLELV